MYCCSLSSCEGFFKVGLLASLEGVQARRVCGPCVLACLDKVCILEEINDVNAGGLVQTGTVFMIDPSRWPSNTLRRIKSECLPEVLDQVACDFIRMKIAYLLGKRLNQNQINVNSCLSVDGSNLWVKSTLHSLNPDGLSKKSAICVDLPACELCATKSCHYKVECDECSQFTCGTWIRLKGACAFCRHNMPR